MTLNKQPMQTSRSAYASNQFLYGDDDYNRTFSSFSKESALRGTQPWIASPATALSQEGHPAATCSPSIYLLRFSSRKLCDVVQPALAFPCSSNSRQFPSFSSFLNRHAGLVTCTVWYRCDDVEIGPDRSRWSRRIPEESTAGVTETTFFDARQPIRGGRVYGIAQASGMKETGGEIGDAIGAPQSG